MIMEHVQSLLLQRRHQQGFPRAGECLAYSPDPTAPVQLSSQALGSLALPPTYVSSVLLTDCLVSLSRENCLMSLLGLQWHQKCHAMCSDSPPLSGSSQVACLGRGQTAHPQAGWPGSHFALTNSAPFAPSWVEPLLFPFTFPLTLLLFQLCKLPSISHFKI